MRLIKHLNDDTIRIGAIKRRAAVTMHLERLDYRDAVTDEFLLQLAHPVDALDNEAKMIELFFSSRSSEGIGNFMDRQVAQPEDR